MKRWLLLVVLPMIFLAIAVSSCSKDDDPLGDFNYPADALYGTWKVVKAGDVAWPFERTTATFNPDGTYYGRGYFGNGSGTYTAKGNTIRCYVDGDLYCYYEVVSLNGNTAVLKMYSASGDYLGMPITCEKQ